MRKFNYLMSVMVVFGISQVFAQNQEQKIDKASAVYPTRVVVAHDFSVSIPVRDMEPTKGPRTEAEQKAFKKLKEKKEGNLNFDMKHRLYPYASSARPFGNDPVWQKQQGKTQAHSNRAPLLNFAGQDSPYSVSDCNGAAGKNHYMQGINTTYAIWDKNGNQVVAATNFNTLFAGVDGASNNDGDPIVIYDDQADRWLVAEFSGAYSSPDYMLVAVSTTSDPTGTWNRYSFDMPNGFPDYMKFGVWRDGYYMGTNTNGGDDVFVFERDVMLAGGASPQMVAFSNPNRPASGFHCIEPLDNDGAFAPTGTPGQFITINDDAWGGANDQLWIYELDVDWSNVGAATFARTQTITTADFDANFGVSWDNIAQLGTSQKVDAVPQILMYRAQYRNWGTSQTIVCAHAVDVDATDHAGLRWYELENTGSGWSIRQQGTYAPDALSRWIPSIAMDANHNIALGYNVSSSSMYPGIRYCGQSALENQNASGIMDIAEETVLNGTASHTSDNRWADYAEMSVDPSDDATFWFTTEYANGGSSKSTQIVSFQFQPAVVYDNDAGATSLLTPVSGLDLTNSESVEVAIKNYGENSISNFPISYQLDGGAVVTENYSASIAAGATVNYTFTGTVDLSIETSYDFKAFTGLSGDENHNNDTIYKTIVHDSPTYCGATGGGNYEKISNVTFGTIDNASGGTEYSDFTTFSTSIDKEASDDITVTISGAYATDQILVWIDFNQNYTFETSEKVYESATGVGPHTGTISIPADALLGITRMRVRLHDSSMGPNDTPCGSSDYGEVEDYSVNITSPVNIVVTEHNSLLQISPNPADDKVVISSTKSLVGNIQIVDVVGKLIYSDVVNGVYNKSFDMSKEANGIYFVKMTKEGKNIETLKFVVKH